MKPTKILNLVLVVFITVVASFVAVRFLVGNGQAIPLSPMNLLITLVAIAILLLLLTLPIWQYKSGLKQAISKRPKRVDPFYAVRVVLLAKASSISGAVFVGWHLGIVLLQLFSPVRASAVLIQNGFGLAASLILVIAAFIAEQICRLPNDPEPDNKQAVQS
jgi:hypothetical protein